MPNFAPILIAHCSTNFAQPQAGRAELIRNVLELEPHVVSFTELGQNDDWDTARRVCAELGYHFAGDKSAEPAVAMRGDTVLLDSGVSFVHAGHAHSAPGDYAYQPRHIAYARGLLEGDSELDWTHHAFHSVLKGSDPDGTLRTLMANEVSRLLTLNSEGRRIATAGGDTNETDTPNNNKPQAQVFTEAGMATVWDDLDEYPDTQVSSPTRHGAIAPIDWVIRNTNDSRLKFINARVIDQEFSDHHTVVVRARVAMRDTIVTTHACPTCGFVHEDARV